MGCVDGIKECAVGIAKYVLFLFNFLILIAAGLLIGLAVKYKEGNAGFDLKSVSTFAIGVAVIIALIAFFGCCGAIKENSCMLTTYAVVVLVIFIIQLALGILALVAVKNNNNQLKNEVDKYLGELYEKYWVPNNDVRKTIDNLQWNRDCCGLYGVTDYAVQNQTHPGQLISSCCPKEENLCTPTQAYPRNCSSAVTQYFEDNIKIIGIVAIVFGAVELLAAIFACCVKNSK